MFYSVVHHLVLVNGNKIITTIITMQADRKSVV